MNYKFFGGVALMVMLIVFPASASMVTFLVVETGIDEGIANTQHGSLWDDGLMTVFFDAGHIVTNYPIARMNKRPAADLSGPLAVDFSEAAEGGVDYFILAFLDYQSQEGPLAPVMITVKLYKTSPQQLIFEQNFPADAAKTLNDEYLIAKNAGRIIASKIKD